MTKVQGNLTIGEGLPPARLFTELGHTGLSHFCTRLSHLGSTVLGSAILLYWARPDWARPYWAWPSLCTGLSHLPLCDAWALSVSTLSCSGLIGALLSLASPASDLLGAAGVSMVNATGSSAAIVNRSPLLEKAADESADESISFAACFEKQAWQMLKSQPSMHDHVQR